MSSRIQPWLRRFGTRLLLPSAPRASGSGALVATRGLVPFPNSLSFLLLRLPYYSLSSSLSSFSLRFLLRRRNAGGLAKTRGLLFFFFFPSVFQLDIENGHFAGNERKQADMEIGYAWVAYGVFHLCSNCKVIDIMLSFEGISKSQEIFFPISLLTP